MSERRDLEAGAVAVRRVLLGIFLGSLAMIGSGVALLWRGLR